MFMIVLFMIKKYKLENIKYKIAKLVKPPYPKSETVERSQPGPRSGTEAMYCNGTKHGSWGWVFRLLFT